MPARRPRRRNTGDGELRRHIAEQADIEHEAAFGAVIRALAGDLGDPEHREQLAALAAGEAVAIRFGWLPDDHAGRRLGQPGEWGWLLADDTVHVW